MTVTPEQLAALDLHGADPFVRELVEHLMAEVERLQGVVDDISRGEVVASRDSKLVTLFYLLTRDHLPSGKVVELVNEVMKADKPVFTDRNIEGFARDIVERLDASS